MAWTLKKKKITNHSSRATIISHMAKIGINEQELIKISGHSSSSSIKPYLQLNDEHHEQHVRRLLWQPVLVGQIAAVLKTVRLKTVFLIKCIL